MSSLEPLHPRITDDEIDLRDLVLILLEGWYWILGAIVAAVLAAVAYLTLTTPTYSTELAFTRTPDGLRTLNAMPGMSYTEEQAALELAQRLAAYENFSRFLEDSESGREALIAALSDVSGDTDLLAAQRQFFRNNLAVTPPEEGRDVASLALSFNDRLAGPEFANGYFRWTQARLEQVLVARAERAQEASLERNQARMDAHLQAYQRDVEARVARMSEADKIRLADLQDRLAAEMDSVVAARQERVRVLRQAEEIARQLGITRPTTPRDLGRQASDREVIYAEINSQEGLPLYFMGADALRAEREVVEANLRDEAKTAEIRSIEKQIQQLQHNREMEALLAREESSPFIEAYNELRQQNILMQANRVSPDDIQVAEVVNWAYQPTRPDAPRRSLVLALALVLGGMLGVMLVFLLRFGRSLRSYRHQQRGGARVYGGEL